MTRYHTTAEEGNTPFTAEQEALRDQEEAEWAAGADDRKARKIRGDRTQILQSTDWMGISDISMSTAWATYRQELRDIPEQEGFPNNVIWPTKTSE